MKIFVTFGIGLGVMAAALPAVAQTYPSKAVRVVIPFPPGAYKCKIGRSHIDGRGLIATADIKAGEVIAPARIGACRTPAGRYTNHSADPNAVMVVVGDRIMVVATRPITGCMGGFDGEEITVSYRAAIATAQEFEACQV